MLDGMDRNRSMSLLLGNVYNQIHHANGAPIALIAQYGFKFKCSAGRTTSFDHDIELNDKHITGLIDPVIPSGAVTKQYSDSKLALAVNELIRKIYLNTASLANLQTDMISRIEAQSTAAASVNSNQDGKIAEMLGKLELNVSGLVSLRRETIELLNTTKTFIEANHERDMSTVRNRQQEIMNDQFAFQPTGSTTAAIITILQTITTLLLTNSFVLVYALDFSKAFDTVRHRTLLKKFALLDLPDKLYNWPVNYFDGRSHCTQIEDAISMLEEITASIIQGWSLGPAAYIVDASDLKTVHPENKIPKFADDTYLIVGSNQAATNVEELENVENWAKRNNLQLNHSKSAEMVFTNPRSKIEATPPPPPSEIPRVVSLKVLGVTLTNSFPMTEHVTNTISSCAQALYALRMLNSQGLNQASLQFLFSAIILAKLKYAFPAWIGFASASDIKKLDSFLARSKRSGFCSTNLPPFEVLSESADSGLFRAITQNPGHVLHRLLPPKKPTTYNMRKRTHDFCIPQRTTNLNNRNFIERMLYKNSY